MSGKRFAILCCLMLASAVGVIVAIVVLEAPPMQATPNLVLVTGGQDSYQQAVALGAQAAANRRGVELEIKPLVDGDSQAAAAALEELSHGGVHGVVICRSVNDRAPLAVRELAEKTKVVTCGEDVWPSHRICHVGTGAYSAGRLCASVVKEALPRGGRIVVLVDDAARGPGAARLAGFRENLIWVGGVSDPHDPPPQLEVVECLEDFGHVGLCARNMRQAASRYPDATCIVDLGDRMEGRSSIAALATTADATGVKLITFDRSDAALAAVEEGSVYAVIGDDPFQQGYQAIDRLADFCREGEISFPARGRGHVNVPASVVRQHGAAEPDGQRRTARRMPTNSAAFLTFSPLMLLAD
jgi:ABC-type sugar transport system substrate-binding protein